MKVKNPNPAHQSAYKLHPWISILFLLEHRPDWNNERLIYKFSKTTERNTLDDNDTEQMQ